jgi:ribose 5-phosphate isomerase B
MDQEQLRRIIQEVLARELSPATPAVAGTTSPSPAELAAPAAVPPPPVSTLAATPAASPSPPAPPATPGGEAAPGLELRLHQKVLTAGDLEAVEPYTAVIVPVGTIISPLVHDVVAAKKLRLRIESEQGRPSVALGADHGGFRMKEALKGFLMEWGYPFFDFGTHSEDAVDYPEFAHKVAKAVAEGHYELGVIVDGAGIGSCMAANKVPGIRAAMCYHAASARNSREHNYANVLTLGGKMLSMEEAREILQVWLETPWGAERHARRVRLIREIEKKYNKD